VIGSSCIGASVVGGVCNNSGGSLVRRGPAYTELALFARIGADGQAELVNHLGVALGSDPEAMLRRLERGEFDAADIAHNPGRRASDRGYDQRVRAIDAPTLARFNADPGRLFEAAGSAGRVALFAVRLDTFPKAKRTASFYIGTNDPVELTQLRRDMLKGPSLPIAAEYMDRAAFDIAERYGKDVFLAIRWLGTQRLRWLFAAKARFDAIAAQLGHGAKGWSGRLLQFVADRMGRHLPPSLYAYR
jgi:D-lactate dehydrogenase